MNALDNGMQASTLKLIYTPNYVRHLVQILYEKSFAVLSLTGKYFAESVKTKNKKDKKKTQTLMWACLISYCGKLLSSSKLFTQRVRMRKHFACI